MKKLFIFLFILLTAVSIGLLMQHDSGYVLINYSEWLLEMPLWLTLLGLGAAFFVLHKLLNLPRFSSRLLSQYRLWSEQRQYHKIQQQTNHGLIQIAEGNWKAAEKILLKAASKTPAPLINYLAAAKAAQEQGHYEQRDEYLRLAHRSTPNAEVAVGLTQAQLQLSHCQYERCLATLNHLRSIVPHHPYVLKLLKHLYNKINSWQELHTLLPALKKQKVFGPMEMEAIELEVYQHLLLAAGTAESQFSLQSAWDAIPKALQKHQQLIKLYTDLLLKQDSGAQAENILLTAINSEWNNELVKRYGLIKGANLPAQLKKAEEWLKVHAKNPILFLTLGRLSTLNQLWGKAQYYFEMSLELNPSSETYLEIGKLYEQLHEQEKAFAAYRAGLLLKPVTE